jgi:hypothetical protein
MNSILEVPEERTHRKTNTEIIMSSTIAGVPSKSRKTDPKKRLLKKKSVSASSVIWTIKPLYVTRTNKVEKKTRMDGKKQINQLILESELGRGSYGTVWLVTHEDNRNKYAMKI